MWLSSASSFQFQPFVRGCAAGMFAGIEFSHLPPSCPDATTLISCRSSRSIIECACYLDGLDDHGSHWRLSLPSPPGCTDKDVLSLLPRQVLEWSESFSKTGLCFIPTRVMRSPAAFSQSWCMSGPLDSAVLSGQFLARLLFPLAAIRPSTDPPTGKDFGRALQPCQSS